MAKSPSWWEGRQEAWCLGQESESFSPQPQAENKKSELEVALGFKPTSSTKPPKTAPPTSDELFKYVSLWGTFLIQTIIQ